MNDYIVRGTLLVFDEWVYDYNYDNGVMHFYDYEGWKFDHHKGYSETRTGHKTIKFAPFTKQHNVFNLSKDSSLNYFKKVDIGEIL